MNNTGGLQLRISRSERDHAVDRLTQAFAEERLTRDEFDERVGQALSARTHAELAALLNDLPPAEPTPAPTATPGTARQIWSAITRCLCCGGEQTPR